MKKHLVKYYANLKNKILPKIFVLNPFMSSLYYLLFSKTFRREQHAVLKGKVKHYNDQKSENANLYTLIRNVHRLEKGLLMRPKKDIFALNFIKETVDNFEKVWMKSNQNEDKQLKWFHDVLQNYFETSGFHPLVENQEKRFRKLVSNYEIPPSNRCIPYVRLEENRPTISYDEFYKLARFRRSVRWFLEKKVPHELVDKAILAANQAPSACNRQPFEYRIIDEPILLQQVANLPMGIKGYVQGIPMMVVVIGNLDAYFDERDRHVIYIDASLANMSFMLALETLGLSSCPINWPDIEILERQMEKALNLQKHQRPLMCMAVGYPDPEGMVAFSEKRNLNQIRKYN